MAKRQVEAPDRIESLIYTIRGQRVMLDSDLARIYGVPPKRLNEQFKRNRERFPEDFAFTLAPEELAQMRSQNATASRRNVRHVPIAFTEHGVLMLANVLKSQTAVEASIRVVRAFIWMREQLAAHKELAQKLKELESRVTEHDGALNELFEAIQQLLTPPADSTREMGFHIRETAPRYRIKRTRRF